MTSGPPGTGTVVVGIDGSPGADDALAWALAEARLRHAPLRVVHAWMFGYVGGSSSGVPFWGGSFDSYTAQGLDIGELHRAAEELVERAIAGLGDDAEGVEIEGRAVQGAAAEALIESVTPEDLLVVGSRGHGGFTDLLLGSVSLQCVHHATCPVVVVHPSKPHEKKEKADGS
jgi:nucleotide-binding universal stress UspA family protein